MSVPSRRLLLYETPETARIARKHLTTRTHTRIRPHEPHIRTRTPAHPHTRLVQDDDSMLSLCLSMEKYISTVHKESCVCHQSPTTSTAFSAASHDAPNVDREGGRERGRKEERESPPGRASEKQTSLTTSNTISSIISLKQFTINQNSVTSCKICPFRPLSAAECQKFWKGAWCTHILQPLRH